MLKSPGDGMNSCQTSTAVLLKKLFHVIGEWNTPWCSKIYVGYDSSVLMTSWFAFIKFEHCIFLLTGKLMLQNDILVLYAHNTFLMLAAFVINHCCRALKCHGGHRHMPSMPID